MFDYQIKQLHKQRKQKERKQNNSICFNPTVMKIQL